LLFLIENRWGITLSLTLRRMLHLGLVLIDNVWISLVCLALGWVVRLGTLLIHPTCSVMMRTSHLLIQPLHVQRNTYKDP
jgi:hypothetical protein